MAMTATTSTPSPPFAPPPDEPLTTKEGWSRWVQRDLQAPSPPGELTLLAPAERAAYDDA
ncbi:hypothetical protein EBO15_09385 [Actinomadura harenae]|uniref:Uncharacterized protein n=1 Tax=Actinomadura harenae TaxID=2483351 RepID=A0A3M2M6V1_9ACTN|nr:hypothetical protein EBO15_09385 [Actinomadura harenae]